MSRYTRTKHFVTNFIDSVAYGNAFPDDMDKTVDPGEVTCEGCKRAAHDTVSDNLGEPRLEVLSSSAHSASPRSGSTWNRLDRPMTILIPRRAFVSTSSSVSTSSTFRAKRSGE